MVFNPDNPNEHDLNKEEEKMEDNKEFVPKQPDYKGDGVAVWIGQDKNGKTLLNIKLLNSINVKAFKNEPKPETKPEL